MSEGLATLNIKINVDSFLRGMHDLTETFRRIGYGFDRKPRPPKRPYRKAWSGMTAREYRASRRAYARALRAYKKVSR